MRAYFVHRFLASRTLRAAGIILIAGASATAQASTIAFNDFGPGNSYSVSGLGIGGVNNLQQGGAFTATATGELSEIVTAMIVTSGPSGYQLNLYADNSNSPGTLLGSYGGSAVSAGLTSDILTPASGVTLTSGQKYWLVASASTTTNMNWRQNNQSVTGPWYYHDGSGTTFVSSTTLVAFEVLVVPEPSSVVLAAVGLGVCVFGASRRRK